MSTRVDVLPLAAAQELARLQENAAAAAPDAVRDVLETDLGRPVDEVFVDFDWGPIAAASPSGLRGEVARGRRGRRQGQRPGIAEVVHRDLAIVRHVARVAERRTDWGRAYGVTALAEEFSTRLREELDYRVEAGSAVEVAGGLESEPRIHVPHGHEQLSTSRVLVTERLRGTSVGQLESAGRSIDPWSRTELADTLVGAELAVMLAGERFHADPHPGNVFLLDDGRIGLLELGATGRLDAFERSSVVTMLSAVRDRDPVLLREAVLTAAATPRDVDVYELDRALARFMAQHLDGAGRLTPRR